MSTLISWTQETWNPTSGCSKISEGCAHCYAERISLKFGWSKKPWTTNNEKENVVCYPDRLRKPRSWKTPTQVFVNSMSDLFHPGIPQEFLGNVFEAMRASPQHVFQVLTKRPEHAVLWQDWPENVWMGTSIESGKYISRMESLRACGASIKFISFEPLLSPIGRPDLTGIDWVIVGGESGPGYRLMNHAWAREIRDQCVAASVPFFFKQDAAFRTETRPWLIEEDGSHWKWEQSPTNREPPQRINF